MTQASIYGKDVQCCAHSKLSWISSANVTHNRYQPKAVYKRLIFDLIIIQPLIFDCLYLTSYTCIWLLRQIYTWYVWLFRIGGKIWKWMINNNCCYTKYLVPLHYTIACTHTQMEPALVSRYKFLALPNNLLYQLHPRVHSKRKLWVRIRNELFLAWIFHCELLLFPAPSDTSKLLALKRSLRGLTDWQELGLALGMEYSVLDSIDKDKGGDVEKCKTAMLHSWLGTGKATKSSLVDALKEIDEEKIADKLLQ